MVVQVILSYIKRCTIKDYSTVQTDMQTNIKPTPKRQNNQTKPTKSNDGDDKDELKKVFIEIKQILKYL